MKLLLAIEQHVTTVAQHCRHLFRLADESPAGPQHSLSSAMALEWPWSYPDQFTVESGGDAFKTGRVTGTLVHLLKCCPYISTNVENESGRN